MHSQRIFLNDPTELGIPDANKSTDGQPVGDEVSKKTLNTTVTPATREQVLKACTNTSGALAAAGIAIRQVFFSSFYNEVNV